MSVDCRAHYPSDFIKESLRTKYFRTAKSLVIRRRAEYEEEWDRIRQTGSKAKAPITLAQMHEIIVDNLRFQLKADDESRI